MHKFMYFKTMPSIVFQNKAIGHNIQNEAIGRNIQNEAIGRLQNYIDSLIIDLKNTIATVVNVR